MDYSSKAALREVGLRVTAPRVAVLDVLVEHPHATADRVAQLVGAKLGKVSKQAVYDVLAACVDAGLVRRIEPAGSPALFETRTGDNHHHLVCRACRLIPASGRATTPVTRSTRPKSSFGACVPPVS
jgi:Fur family ferric uptake transcriptional regulator